MALPERIYTETELDRARKRGKWLGRAQGAGAILVGAAVLEMLGWIPTVLVLGVVGYGLYRLLSKQPDPED